MSGTGPRATLRAGWLGFAAAWDTVRWIEGGGLGELAAGFDGEERPAPETRLLVERAERVADRVLRVLARLPRSPWRATCLYRSVAACLVRRRLGLPARLALGVRSGPCGEDGVDAHAWTEEDADDASAGEGWTPLVRPAERR